VQVLLWWRGAGSKRLLLHPHALHVLRRRLHQWARLHLVDHTHTATGDVR
jgi:hypothetical protein